MVLRGELSPTTANHNFKQQGCHANTERSSVCQPPAPNARPEGRGPSRYRRGLVSAGWRKVEGRRRHRFHVAENRRRVCERLALEDGPPGCRGSLNRTHSRAFRGKGCSLVEPFTRKPLRRWISPHRSRKRSRQTEDREQGVPPLPQSPCASSAPVGVVADFLRHCGP